MATEADPSVWFGGTPAALAADRFEILYALDGRGRALHTNEWERKAPPRLHVYRTPDALAMRVAADVPDDVARALARTLATERPAAPGTPLACAPDLLALLGASTFDAGPSWVLEAAAPAPDTDVVTAAPALFEHAMGDWLPDVPHRAPFLVLTEAGRARSVSASVRIGPRAHEAGVETAPDARGRGFATRVVAAWAAAVRAAGAAPCYTTSWDNEASRRIAERIGGRLLGEDVRIL